MNCNDHAFQNLSFATQCDVTRRTFIQRAAGGIGLAALGGLLGSNPQAFAGATTLPGFPNFAPKAKRIIYLFQSGAPSQMDLFDPKPALAAKRGENLPDSIRQGQRLTQTPGVKQGRHRACRRQQLTHGQPRACGHRRPTPE